jgi:hypothetical protein
MLQVLFYEVHVYYVCVLVYYFHARSMKYTGDSDSKNVSAFCFVHSVRTFVRIPRLSDRVCVKNSQVLIFQALEA